MYTVSSGWKTLTLPWHFSAFSSCLLCMSLESIQGTGYTSIPEKLSRTLIDEFVVTCCDCRNLSILVCQSPLMMWGDFGCLDHTFSLPIWTGVLGQWSHVGCHYTCQTPGFLQRWRKCLSKTMPSGNPCVAKMSLSVLRSAEDDLDFIREISNHLLFVSATMRIGKGLQSQHSARTTSLLSIPKGATVL